MNNEKYIYTFVKNTLSPADREVQLAHAMYFMTQEMIFRGTYYNGHPAIVNCDGGGDKGFKKVLDKLQSNQIPHTPYSDPDKPEWGITAIATHPLDEDQREVLLNYRLYTPR